MEKKKRRGGDRKLAGRVGEGKNELCTEYQGTRGSEVDDQGFERRRMGERTAFRKPGCNHCSSPLPCLSPMKEYYLPADSRVVFSKQPPISRL